MLSVCLEEDPFPGRLNYLACFAVLFLILKSEMSTGTA